MVDEDLLPNTSWAVKSWVEQNKKTWPPHVHQILSGTQMAISSVGLGVTCNVTVNNMRACFRYAFDFCMERSS